MTSPPSRLFPLAFHPDEKVARGFVRVLGEMVIQARILARPSRRTSVESVHDMRLLIKRLRALLWLASPAFAASALHQSKSRLREASHQLAAQRELVVMRAILEGLARETGKAADRKTLLRLAHAQSSQSAITAKVEPLRQAAAIVLKTINELQLETKDNAHWPSPSERLAKAFRASEKAGKKALRGKDPAQFHDWRKRAKRLLYQLQLTHGDADKRMAKTIARVDQLQDKLGDYQDSVMAQDHLQKYPPGEIARRLVRQSVRLLEKRKHRLRKKVRKLARHFKNK